jgi:D-alanyl-D-alanine carboxypeptidase (penicillin-binding protein 5/6)
VRLTIWTTFGLTAAAVGGITAAVGAPPWSSQLVQQLPARYVFPGPPPRIPWPSAGQAMLDVVGIGRLGGSGQVTAAVPIASVAKVLTAYQILIDHPLPPGSGGPPITVSGEEADAYGHEVAENESVVPVSRGEVLTERQALEGLLLASADNVAQILARWDAGSVPEFLARENATAARLGMSRSKYTDPSGLDRGTVSTAPDQLLLARAAMRNPAFAQLVQEQTAVIPVAGKIHNFNALLGRDGFVGIKTGSTSAAGGCMMFAADVTAGPGGTPLRVLGVVLGQPGTASTILPHALAEARRLVDAARVALATATVASAGQRVAVAREAMNADRPLVASSDVVVLGWPGLGYTVQVFGTPSAPMLAVRSESAPEYRIISRLR